MSDNLTSSDIGVKELVSGLITSIFDSVLAAQADQEQTFTEINAALQQNETEFAERYVGELEVDNQLREWFPALEKPEGYMLEAGMHVAISGPTEPLSLLDVHGVSLWRLGEEHLQPSKDRSPPSRSLSQAGVEFLRSCARLRMGERQRVGLRQARDRGMPRVVIDSGKISAKLSFSVSRESAEPEVPVVRAAVPLTPRGGPLKRGTSGPQATAEPTPAAAPPAAAPPAVRSGPLRLLVRSSSSTSSADSQLGFEGEFELHFRTVL